MLSSILSFKHIYITPTQIIFLPFTCYFEINSARTYIISANQTFFIVMAMAQPVKKALEAIGNKNKYQWVVFFIMFMLNAFVNMIIVGPTFIYMNPLFKCEGHTELVDESEACDILDQCQTQSPFTIVGELSLYCDKQAQRNIIQSALSIGAVIGLLVANVISDNKGKKTALIVTQLSAMLGTGLNLVGAKYDLIPVLVAAQFFCGFSGYSMMFLTYMYPSECFDDVFRQKAVVALNYSWCATFSLLGVLYYWYNYWFDYLLYITLIPMTITLVFSMIFMVEGPNYLYNKKKIEQCLSSLKFIAKMNGTMEDYEYIAQDFKYEEAEEQKKMPVSVIENLKYVIGKRKYLVAIICLCISETGANLNYWACNYAFDQIGYEYGTNMIAVGILESFSFASLNLVIEKIPRKKTLLVFYSLMAGIGFLFFIQEIQDSKIGSIVVLGVIRYIGTMSYTIIIILLTESFPSNVQSICTGIIQSFGQLGSFLGPIVITICINMKIYPIIVLSFVILATVVIPVSFLKEPKHTRTTIDPNEVQDLGASIHIPNDEEREEKAKLITHENDNIASGTKKQ